MIKIASEMRYCQDIGLFAIDRSKTSCKHRTSFCNANCYNNKLYPIFKGMATKDIRNEKYWQSLTGQNLKLDLDRKHHATDRVRLMTRGEAFSNDSDIDRVKDLITSNSNRLFWIPTRAWRNRALRIRIQTEITTLKNARVQASLDPSNSRHEINQLIIDGWSTMFFGDDENPAVNGSIKCQKTWMHKKAVCITCKTGCFSKNQNHVWLKKH